MGVGGRKEPYPKPQTRAVNQGPVIECILINSTVLKLFLSLLYLEFSDSILTHILHICVHINHISYQNLINPMALFVGSLPEQS